MGKTFLSDIDLNKNNLNNARIQNLASDPASPVIGQIYFNTSTQKLRQYTSGGWVEYGTGAGAGDVSSNTTTSVDSELVLFNGTTGKNIKRATGTGYAKLTNGVLSTQSTPIPVTDGGTGSSTRNFVDLTSTETVGGVKTFSNSPIVPTPTTGTQAVNKDYVDLAVQGISWKAPVRAATTSNGTLSSAYTNGSVIDGVTLATGDRILIKNQTTGSENGIYTVNASGAPTRSTDADTGSELVQAAIFVREGTTQAESAYVVSNDGTITVGTTAITFVQFATAGGVQQASTTVSGITRYATTAEAQAKSVSNAAVTPAALGDFARKYTSLIGDGTSTSISVTHNLGSQFVSANIYDASNNAMVECDVILTSSSQTTFTFSTAPTNNQYRVVIVG